MQCYSLKTPQTPSANTVMQPNHTCSANPISNTPSAATAFQKVFDAIDTNNDGGIDKNEFFHFLEELMNPQMSDYVGCGDSGHGDGRGDAEAEKAALVAALGAKAAQKGHDVFMSADADATRFLTGDLDGTMDNDIIQRLVDRGYCVIVGGRMECTSKGRELLQFIDGGKGLESQQMAYHIEDYEASLVAKMGHSYCDKGFRLFNTADLNATRILLDDFNGQMNPDVIEKMIRGGYFQVENGQLQATEKGVALFEFMRNPATGLNPNIS